MSDGSPGNQVRVLHVTEAAAGGVLRHLEYILPSLQKQGCHCACLVFSARADHPRLQNLTAAWNRLGIETSFLRLQPRWLPRPWIWWRIIRELRSAVCRFRPDIIHLHSSIAGAAGRLARCLLPRQIRLVYSPHAFCWHPEMKFLARHGAAAAEKILSGCTDRYALVGAGEVTQGNLMGLPWDGRIRMAENGLPAGWRDKILSREEARRILKIPSGEFAVVIPGRFSWQKAQIPFLEMLEELSLPENCRFYFCGDGTVRIPGCFAGGLRSSRYVFLDQIRNLDCLFSGFDLGVMPSRYEGLSYALLEMLASDLPVLAADISETRSVKEKLRPLGVSLGLWKNPREFAAMLKDSMIPGNIKKAGPEIPGIFSLQEQTRILQELYGELCRESGKK